MFAEIIVAGGKYSKNETDANATSLSKRFLEMGVDVKYISSVGDDETLLAKSIYSAVNRSELIVFLGGIDIDEGDITKRVLQKCIGIKMRTSSATTKKVKDYCARTDRIVDDEAKAVAQVFDKATIFDNEDGVAPGQALRSGKQTILLLPANAHELQAMVEPYIAPFVGKLTSTVVKRKTLRLIDISAVQVNKLLGEKINSRNPLISGREHDGEILLRITARGKSEGAANKLCVKTVEELAQTFGRHIYGNIDEKLSHIVVNLLKKHKLTLSTAESCTAGLVSQQVTNVPGSSQVFSMGVSTYSNEMKTEVLGVPTATLDHHGAVSAEVAKEMAKRVREKAQSDIGVSVTGIAGPDGGSAEKPVGLVYIALADENGVYVRKCDFAKGAEVSRDLVRTLSANAALDLVRLYLLSYPNELPGKDLNDMNEYLTSNDPAWIYKYTAKNDRTHYEPLLKRFVKYFMPWAGDGAFEVVRKVVLNAAVVTMAIALFFIGSYYLDLFASGRDTDAWRDAEEIARRYATMNPDGPSRFDILREEFNSESLIGWINIPGIIVNYPVFQGPDNDLYLDNTFAHVPNRAGEIFIDYRNKIDPDGPNGRSQNVTIYGHSMANGTKFGQLNRYMPNRHVNFLTHYREFHHITFDTMYEDAEYVIFAAFVIHVSPNDDEGRFPFHYRQWDFGDDEAFENFVEQVMRRSFFIPPDEVLPVAGDQIINLSTCAYDFNDARLAVFARRIREDESRYFDMSQAQRNPAPLKPAAWYIRHSSWTRPTFDADGFITNMPFWPEHDINLALPGQGGNPESTMSEPPESIEPPPESYYRWWWNLPPESLRYIPAPGTSTPPESRPPVVTPSPPSAPPSAPPSSPPPVSEAPPASEVSSLPPESIAPPPESEEPDPVTEG